MDALHIFISKMIIRHGIESVSILYPEIKKNEQDIDNISELILDELPKSDTFVNSIIKLEIPKFFKTDDDKRKKYISILFNSSFYFHLIQIDEKCSRLLREEIRGQKLFLDNNILYSLIGLHGEYILRAVHSLLSFASILGYGLWVTTKTIDEFQNSLNWKLNELKQSPPIPTDLAKLAIENLDQDNFLVIYWKEFVKNRLTIDEFISEKSHIESILDGFNIQTSNKYRKDIEDLQEHQI